MSRLRTRGRGGGGVGGGGGTRHGRRGDVRSGGRLALLAWGGLWVGRSGEDSVVIVLGSEA